MNAFLILALGVAVVVGLIVFLRVNPFLSLLAAAIVVSCGVPMTGTNWEEIIARVSIAFGGAATKVGILIAMGAIVGKCMLDSGSADRIVRSVSRLFGEKMIPAALLTSGFILSIPVFYEATFYLLLPIAKSMYRAVRKNYILYLMCIGFGATLSHTLVPPTPGPVAVAEGLGVPMGSMLLVSLIVGACTCPFAFLIAYTMNRLHPNPEVHFDEEYTQTGPDKLPENIVSATDPDADKKLPSLFLSLAPIVLPVLLIGIQTTLDMFEKSTTHNYVQQRLAEGNPVQKEELDNLKKSGELFWSKDLSTLRGVGRFVGDPRAALILAAIFAMIVLWQFKHLTLTDLSHRVEASLISAGIMIMIIAAGGAFGEMLAQAGVGNAIRELAEKHGNLTGTTILLLAFGVAALLKTAQGSSTVAMITTSGIFHGFLNNEASPVVLPYHLAYVAVCIGLGSCVTGWMNDAGFWIFCKMGGIKESDALKTWTVGLVLLGLSGLLVALLFSRILPLT